MVLCPYKGPISAEQGMEKGCHLLSQFFCFVLFLFFFKDSFPILTIHVTG